MKRIDANFNKLNINLQKYSEILNPAVESLLNRSDVVQEGESYEASVITSGRHVKIPTDPELSFAMLTNTSR